VKSFIYDSELVTGLSKQAAIIARIPGSFMDEAEVKIKWKIQAVEHSATNGYGGIYGVSWLTPASPDPDNTAVDRCSVGTYGKAWEITKSESLTVARKISFYPCPPKHDPEGYTKGSGTIDIDVYQKNPRVAYEISATLTLATGKNIPLAPVVARMDEKDMIRQEYITHIVSAPTSGVKVPTRDKIVLESSLGEGGWGSYTVSADDGTYPYQYVVEDGMKQMWTDYKIAFDARATVAVPLIDYYAQWRPPTGSNLVDPYAAYPTTATLAADQTIKVTSAYRNPERNEKFSKATASRHMLGRALDISINNIGGYGSKSRGVAFYKAWEVIHRLNTGTYNPTRTTTTSSSVPTADRWALETGGASNILTSNGGWVTSRYNKAKKKVFVHTLKQILTTMVS